MLAWDVVRRTGLLLIISDSCGDAIPLQVMAWSSAEVGAAGWSGAVPSLGDIDQWFGTEQMVVAKESGREVYEGFRREIRRAGRRAERGSRRLPEILRGCTAWQGRGRMT